LSGKALRGWAHPGLEPGTRNYTVSLQRNNPLHCSEIILAKPGLNELFMDEPYVANEKINKNNEVFSRLTTLSLFVQGVSVVNRWLAPPA
jgi:hypothetical protein